MSWFSNPHNVDEFDYAATDYVIIRDTCTRWTYFRSVFLITLFK